MSETRSCPACEGDGWTYSGISWDHMTCPVCKGIGQVAAQEPSRALELVLEVALVLAICAMVALGVWG